MFLILEVFRPFFLETMLIWSFQGVSECFLRVNRVLFLSIYLWTVWEATSELAKESGLGEKKYF